MYNKQTQDEEHLMRLIEAMHIKPNDRILDLGMGSGYVSFGMAKSCRDAKIVGLDIVEEALQKNRGKINRRISYKYRIYIL